MEKHTRQMLKSLLTMMLVVIMVLSSAVPAMAAPGRSYGRSNWGRGWWNWWGYGYEEPESAAEEAEEEEAAPEESVTEEAEEPESAAEESEEAAEEEAVSEEAAVEEAAEEAASEESEAEEIPAEEETPAAEEPAEVIFPAQNFKAEDADNDLTVTVEAPEGALPENAGMRIRKVKASDYQAAAMDAVSGEIDVVLAVDISFYDENGAEIEPAVPVQVTMTAPEIAQIAEPIVVHISDETEATVVDQAEDVETAEDELAFESPEFSVYLVIDDGNTEVTFRRTYKFTTDGTTPWEFYNKAGQKVDNQIMKDGDKLEEVGTPYVAGKSFKGWVVAATDDETVTVGDPVVIGEAITGIKKDGTVTLKADYDDVIYATFHENVKDAEEDVIQTRKVTDENGDVLISDVIAPQPDVTHIFYAWTDGDTEYPVYNEQNVLVSTTINLKQHTDLYPVFVEAYWLRFISGETGSHASYVPAQFVRRDDKLTQLPVPTRTGYSFLGWFEGSIEDNVITYGNQVTDGTGKVTNPASGLTLTAEKALFGKWQANTDAKYTVVIWRQKVTDSKDAADSEKTYDYAESFTRNGTTDAEVSASDADKSKSGGDYTGFHFGRTSQTSETINADGSTVIDVFYDRDLMAVNFYYQNGHQPEGATTSYIYTPTTSDSGTQYGVMSDGSYVELTRKTGASTTRVYYTYYDDWYRNTEYTGTFYTREYQWFPVYDYVYTATQYNGTNLPTSTNTTYYALTGTNWLGKPTYSELTRRTETITPTDWVYVIDGVEYPYTGTRYTRSQNNNRPYMVTFTGLYGQSYEQNGYIWPSSQKWNEQQYGGGTTQTFQTGFTRTSSPYNLYDQGNPESSVIYHYKETLNGGEYLESEGNRYIAYCSGGSFNFENKFDGFTVNSYNTGTNGYSKTGGSNTNLNNTPSTYPLHVYHTRNKWSIIYKSEGTEVTKREKIFYEAPLNDYDLSMEAAGLAEKPHYEFKGWYADETCTTPFNFNSTMPNANVVVYAKWEPVYYQILVDPDGGVITQDIGATYMWKTYGETFDRYEVSRDYIEDEAGTYKYVYEDGRNDPDGNISVRTATYEIAEEGYTGTKYRKLESSDPKSYTLVGWYLVDENGNRTDTPYDFDAEVEGPVWIRAKWRLSGAYQLQYNAVMKDGDAEISGVFNQENPEAKYSDGAQVIVQGSPSDITPLYVFDGWFVADVDGNPLDDNGGNYYKPGDKLELDAASWAKSGALIFLRAHYTKVEESSDPVAITNLYFDGNGGTTSVTEADLDSLQVTGETEKLKLSVSGNKVTVENIQVNGTLKPFGADKFSKEGCVFLGWNHNKAAADAGTVEFTSDVIVGVDNLPDTANTLYAVWSEAFYVVTSHDAVVTAYAVTEYKDGINLREIAENNGYLYGGYFKAYMGVNDEDADVIGTESGTKVEKLSVYDASSLKAGSVRFWDKKQAYKSADGADPGSSVKPVGGKIYYVKEVPDGYLHSRVSYVYDWSDGYKLTKFYLLTAVDDNVYTSVDFLVKPGEKTYTAKLAASFSIVQRNSTTKVTTNASDFGLSRALVGNAEASDLIQKGLEFTMLPRWTTLDGEVVTGTERSFVFNDITKDGIAEK